jgi:bile acid-coenzyme A ligase
LCASPLYHNNGFSYCFAPLLRGDQVILLGHFDAARAVDLIERHGVTMTVLVPTMLQRIARLPDVRDRDFSSLLRVVYGGASLPEWVARTWLELVPPERFHFVYGGSEVVGVATCTGREWLEHPGTTGVAVSCDIAILDGDRKPLPPGEVGEIWMRLHSEQQPFQYIGTPTPAPILGGYRTYGDMGWLDEDGYLYIADRRQDMIVTGGVNVFPAEVEAALSEHPGLVDAVVIGIPDAEWGHRVHAVVQPVDPADPPSTDDLRAFCKERLSGPKVPKDFEIVEEMPRTSAGKVNRSRLVEARSPAG